MTADPRFATTDPALFRGLIVAAIPSVMIWGAIVLTLKAIL